MKAFLGILGGFAVALTATASTPPLQFVLNGPARCEERTLRQELRIFKDPTLFLGNLALIEQDPSFGWKALEKERPLLGILRPGEVRMVLGSETEFKNFGHIAKLYELVEPSFRPPPGSSQHVKIIPVVLCGEGDAYRNTVGFVIATELVAALTPPKGEGLPPSTYPNPIPKLGKESAP